jgi:hypothetical protein
MRYISFEGNKDLIHRDSIVKSWLNNADMVEQRLIYLVAARKEHVTASEFCVLCPDAESLLVLYAERYKSSGDQVGTIMT